MIEVGMSGHFRLEVRDAVSHEVKHVRDFDNLITNQGLNGYGLSNDRYLLNICHVGTGTSAPSVNDVGMNVPLATTSGVQETKHIAPVAPEWISHRVNRYRFAVGAATGNVTEVGIGGEYYFWSRALVVDELGNPSPVTVLPNEYLDVIYTLRMYPNLDDIPFSFELGGVTYSGTARPQNIQESHISGSTNIAVNGGIVPNSGIEIFTAYNGGNLGNINQGPQNYTRSVSNFVSSYSINEYIMGSYQRDFTMTLGLDAANIGGIDMVSICPRGVGNYGTIGSQLALQTQIKFDKTIPKDNTNSIKFVLRAKWNRH